MWFRVEYIFYKFSEIFWKVSEKVRLTFYISFTGGGAPPPVASTENPRAGSLSVQLYSCTAVMSVWYVIWRCEKHNTSVLYYPLVVSSSTHVRCQIHQKTEIKMAPHDTKVETSKNSADTYNFQNWHQIPTTCKVLGFWNFRSLSQNWPLYTYSCTAVGGNLEWV